MPGYVVEYHRTSGDWRLLEFPGVDGHRDALRERLTRERARASSDWEVVSLNSESRDAVMRTHARYFEGRELEPIR